MDDVLHGITFGNCLPVSSRQVIHRSGQKTEAPSSLLFLYQGLSAGLGIVDSTRTHAGLSLFHGGLELSVRRDDGSSASPRTATTTRLPMLPTFLDPMTAANRSVSYFFGTDLLTHVDASFEPFLGQNSVYSKSLYGRRSS